MYPPLCLTIPYTVERPRSPPPLRGVLRREEGLEQTKLRVHVHPGAGIADGQQHVHARLHVHAIGHVGLGQDDATRLHDERTALRHPVARVDGEIQHDATHLTRVDVDRRQSLFRNHLQIDPIAECLGQHVGEIGEDCVQIQLSPAAASDAAKTPGADW